MSKNTSIKINYIFNILLSYLDTLFPIITAPYISRTLGAENLGKINFANSLINCFIIAAAFGTAAYGIREIAKVKDNPELLNIVFSELTVIRAIATTIMTILYLIVIFSFDIFKGELLYIILLPNLIISVIQIDWFYQGISNFKYITMRAGIMKMICLILMFVTVKSENDYTNYALIIVFGMIGSCILNYLYSRKFVSISLKNINIFRHKSLYIFFITSIMFTIYLMLDQILLGIMQNSSYVAFLNRSKTIVAMVTAIITSLITVLIPKASAYYTSNKTMVNDLFKKALDFIYIVCIPSTVGLIFLSYEIMYILGGYEFAQYYKLLAALAITIPFVSVRSLLKNQFIIPSGNETFVAKSETIATVIYVVLNIALIPSYGLLACVIAIFSYEAITLITTFIYCKKTENFLLLSKSLLNTFIATIPIVLIIYIIKALGMSHIFTMLLSALIAAPLYFTILFILKDYVVKEVILFATKFIKSKRSD